MAACPTTLNRAWHQAQLPQSCGVEIDDLTRGDRCRAFLSRSACRVMGGPRDEVQGSDGASVGGAGHLSMRQVLRRSPESAGLRNHTSRRAGEINVSSGGLEAFAWVARARQRVVEVPAPRSRAVPGGKRDGAAANARRKGRPMQNREKAVLHDLRPIRSRSEAPRVAEEAVRRALHVQTVQADHDRSESLVEDPLQEKRRRVLNAADCSSGPGVPGLGGTGADASVEIQRHVESHRKMVASGRDAFSIQAYAFNRRLVEAAGLEEVLELIACELDLTVSSRTTISAVNAATALHRVASHVAARQLSTWDKCLVARRREMVQLVKATVALIPQCRTQSLANILWALAKIGGPALYEPEVQLLVDALMPKVDDLSTQHLANISAALATSRHAAPLLLEAMGQRAAKIVDVFRPQELSQLVWASAVLGHGSPSLFDAIDRLVCTRAAGSGSSEAVFRTWNEQHLVNLAWAYAVLGELGRPAFASLWRHIGNDMEGVTTVESASRNRERHLCQLHQVMLSIKLGVSGADVSASTAAFASIEWLRVQAEEAWQEEMARPRLQSALEKEVACSLADTGRLCVSNYVSADYSLDFAIPDERLAVEVDGPSHYSRNTGPQGTDLRKHEHHSEGRLMRCYTGIWCGLQAGMVLTQFMHWGRRM